MSATGARRPTPGSCVREQHLQVAHRGLLEIVAAGVAVEAARAAPGSCR